LAVLNAARADPAGMAEALRTYRGRFHGNLVALPGNNARLITREGAAPVDEAIAFLTAQPALPQLAPAQDLAEGAAIHVADQGRRGLLGHDNSDGSNMLARFQRHRDQRGVAEVIQYGASDALEVVRQLIVDDGVADRSHRRILFDPNLRFAGVACGPHRDFGTMCVIDFAADGDALTSFQTHPPAGMSLEASR
jgi:uncharacterized protein YkwD